MLDVEDSFIDEYIHGLANPEELQEDGAALDTVQYRSSGTDANP